MRGPKRRVIEPVSDITLSDWDRVLGRVRVKGEEVPAARFDRETSVVCCDRRYCLCDLVVFYLFEAIVKLKHHVPQSIRPMLGPR